MVNFYDEVEIEDFAWDPSAKVFHYPCPCGDRFEITKSQLRDGEEIATCPSCSLIIRVVYDYLDWEDYTTTDEEDNALDRTVDKERPEISTPPKLPIHSTSAADDDVVQQVVKDTAMPSTIVVPREGIGNGA